MIKTRLKMNINLNNESEDLKKLIEIGFIKTFDRYKGTLDGLEFSERRTIMAIKDLDVSRDLASLEIFLMDEQDLNICIQVLTTLIEYIDKNALFKKL